MVNTKKFSQFSTATLTSISTGIVGLESGVNIQSPRYPVWTTATRPTPPFNGLMGVNSDFEQYEWYDGISGQWVQFEDSGDIAELIARLAAHTVGDGASMIGLQDQSNVSNKTVQDLANATILTLSNNGTLENGSVMLAGSGVTFTPGAGTLTISASGTGGTVTSLTQSTGITLTPNPITTTGSIALADVATLTGLVNLTGGVAPPIPHTLTEWIDAAIGSTQGDILYRNATDWVVLAPGTAGFSLQTGGAAANPSYSNTFTNSTLVTPASLGVQQQALNMNSHLINNVTDPVSAQDAATKNYVDQNALSGTSVYAATINTSMNATQAGAGVGATLTDASGTFAALSLDGVAIPLNSDVLVKNTGTGVTAANEGIYKLTTNGDGISIPWQLTRSVEYDTPEQINNTGLIIVQNGSTLAGTGWYNTATIVTVDTTNFNYAQFGTGGTVTSISAADSTVTLTPNPIVTTGTIAVNTASFVRTVKIQVFTSNGTYTPSTGLIGCIVEGVGGGGGSGGLGSSGGQSAASGGGGGGGYFRKIFTATEIGANASVTIGAAGAAGTNAPGNGGTGGTTTFDPAGTGATLTGNGGTGSLSSTSTATSVVSPAAGNGGAASGGDINIGGCYGQNGIVINGASGVYMSGIGGGTLLGVSASGGGVTNNYGSGAPGQLASGAGNFAGIGGGPGIIIVTEFCNQ